MDNNNEIKLTSLQKAKKKYYEKIKNDPEYKAKRSTPEYKQKLMEAVKKYNLKVKDTDEFKRKVSEQKKLYYNRIKTERLLEIIV